MFLILSICAISYINAADHDGGEVATQRSPSHFHRDPSPHSHSLPTPLPSLTLSPSTPQRKHKELVIDIPLREHELGQLKDRDCKEIYLNGVYVGYESDDNFFKKYSLTISPDTINPDVEVLSLKGCGLTDALIERIGEFKKLRRLVLAANHITDTSVFSSISRLESLQSLSLAINDGITNACVPTLLAMSSLIELDLSHNDKIDDGVAGTFLGGPTRSLKLNVNGTGISKQVRWKIDDKYRVQK